MWAGVLKKPNKGKVFRYYRGELMNTRIEYDDNKERKNMSDRISKMVSEEDIAITTTPKNISYSDALRMGSGKKKVIYTHPTQECVESQEKTTTRHMNNDRYQEHGRCTKRHITGTKMIIPHTIRIFTRRRCYSHNIHRL